MEMRDEVLDREKQMIQSSKLMPTFVWNPHGFQVVDAIPCPLMPKGEMFTAAHYIRIFSSKSLLGVEREVKGDSSWIRTMQGKAAKSKSDKNVLQCQFISNCTISTASIVLAGPSSL
jgi:hypothetical protein